MSNCTLPAAMPGYLADEQGRLVPEANIPDAVRLRNDLVCELVGEVRQASAQLATLKARLLGKVAEHIALIATEYGVAISGANGSCSLASFDGTLKIERTSADRVAVGEQIHAAEALVREYLADATREAAPALVAIVDRAFRRHPKTGNLNVARLLDFVAVKIDDPRWQQAQRAIRDSLHQAGSVTYFRAYARADASEPWRQIPLDFSTIAPAEQAVTGAADTAWPDGLER